MRETLNLVSLPPCGGGLGWGVLCDGGVNALDHTFDILENFVVPKSQDAKALLCKPSRPFSVGIDAQRVLASIDFNDEFGLEADEIGHEGSDRRLTPEMTTIDLFASQTEPETLFGVGHATAKGTRYSEVHALSINCGAPPPQPAPTRGEGVVREGHHA
jgi:hypothetical protein